MGAWALLLVCCLLLTGCASSPAVSQAPASLPAESTAAAQTQPPVQQEENAGITLQANTTQFKAGKQSILELRVQCECTVTEDVVIRDEADQVLAVLQNNGSGEMKTQLPFRRENVGEGYFVASAGSAESQRLPYSVQREVTESMVRALYEVTGELGAFIAESDFSDPYSEEAFAAVRSYLEKHAQVKGVTENGDALVFSTADGLLATYGLARSTDGYLGFSDTEDVYESCLAGQDLQEMWIQCPEAPTGEKCIILSPDDDDSVINEHAMYAEKIVRGSFKQVQHLKKEAALEVLATGDFTDCEMLILNAHGWQLHRSDGTPMLFFKVMNTDDADMCLDFLNRTAAGLETLENPDYNRMENSYGVLNVGVTQSGEAYEEFCLSSLYLENVLRDRTFDNTVVYMGVCYGGSDGRLNGFLLEHGASLLFGCHAPLNSGYSVAVLYEMMKALGTKDADGEYGLYTDGLQNVGRHSVEPMYVEVMGYDAEHMRRAVQNYDALSDAEKRREDTLPENAGEQEKINHEYKQFMQIFDLMDESPQHLLRAVPAGSLRVIRGECQAQGSVMLPDGTPADGAMVTMYRWLDHQFKPYEHQCVVNAQGLYAFSALPYGVYIAQADYMGFTGYVPVTVTEKQVEIDQIIIDFGLELMGEVLWQNADHASSQRNYDQLMVTPVLTKGSERLTEAFPLLLSGMKENMESQRAQVAATPAGEQSGFIEWTLEEAYSTGDCLSMHLSAMSYQGGAMRPLHGEWIYNVNVNTGEWLRFPDLLSAQGKTDELRAGWAKLLENYSDSELNYDRTDIVERAMQGEIGSWMMTDEGLMLRFDLYEVAAYASGPADIIIPYDALAGEIQAQYVPVKTVSAEQENTMQTVSVLSGQMYLPWGDSTQRAVHFEGCAEHVWVYSCSKENPDNHETLVYYGRGVQDEDICLPMCEGNAYHVLWTTGDVLHDQTIVFP